MSAILNVINQALLPADRERIMKEAARDELAAKEAGLLAAQELINDWQLYGNPSYQMCAKLAATLEKVDAK